MRWLCVLLLVVMSADANASWGSGSCPPVGGPEWVVHKGDATQYDLMLGDRQIGAWSMTTNVYRPRINWPPWWGTPSDGPPLGSPPLPRESACDKCAEQGVDRSKIGEGYSVNGESASREDAEKAIDAASIPDDSKKRRVVVIGSKAERTEALKIVGQPTWASVTEWEPTAWQVRDSGFVTTGHPTTYVLEPDGSVVHRQDDLIGLAEAVRRADPNYDPKQDPDLRKLPDAPAPGDSGTALALVAAAGSLAISAGLVLLRRKPS